MGPQEGLAGMGAQQAPQAQVSIEEVMQALMSGMSPEELVAKGVPPEVVQQAIQMLQKQAEQEQMQAQGQAKPQEGLAGMRA